MRTEIESEQKAETEQDIQTEEPGQEDVTAQNEEAAKHVDIVPFEFNEKIVRTVYRMGTPWFIASDVCTILDIVKSRNAVARLDEDEQTVLNPGEADNSRIVTLINESGLYALVLTSRKPEAKTFRRWVTSKVLPSIRRTGSYSQQPTLDPATEHRDIADIIERRAGIYIVTINGEQRRMLHTNGGEIITIATEAMSSMMAGSLISAEGTLNLLLAVTLFPELETQSEIATLKRFLGHGAAVARRYLATAQSRTAESEIPPVGLPH